MHSIFNKSFILLFFSSVGIAGTIIVPVNSNTIQSALDGSMTGDTVIVEAGTYFETIDFKSKSIALLSRDGPENTIISGRMNSKNSVVSFISEEDTSAILEGFTIQDGNASQGGGILCRSSSPKIHNNIITRNRAASGGGIYCDEGSNPMIQYNQISDNTAYGDMFYGGEDVSQRQFKCNYRKKYNFRK